MIRYPHLSSLAVNFPLAIVAVNLSQWTGFDDTTKEVSLDERFCLESGGNGSIFLFTLRKQCFEVLCRGGGAVIARAGFEACLSCLAFTDGICLDELLVKDLANSVSCGSL